MSRTGKLNSTIHGNHHVLIEPHHHRDIHPSHQNPTKMFDFTQNQNSKTVGTDSNCEPGFETKILLHRSLKG